MQAREKEAEEYVHAAKKLGEKSLTQWKPRHGDAGENYEKAAKIYRSLYTTDGPGGPAEASITPLNQASLCYDKAAKHYAKAKSAVSALNAQEAHAAMFADAAAGLAQQAERERRKNAAAYHGPAAGSPAEAAALRVLQQAVQQSETAARMYRDEVNMERHAVFLAKAAEALRLFARYLAATGKDPALLRTVREGYVARTLAAIRAYRGLVETASEKGPAKLAAYALPDLYRSLVLHLLRDGGDLRAAVWATKHALGFVGPGGEEEEEQGGGGGDDTDKAKQQQQQQQRYSPINMRYKEDRNLYKILQQPTNAAKAGLEIIVMCLYSPRAAAAAPGGPSASLADGVTWALDEQANLTTVFGYGGSPEESAAQALISALRDGEPEMLEEAKAQHPLNFIIPDVTKMAKQLQLPGGGGGGGAAGAAGVAAAAGGGTATGTGTGAQTGVENNEEEFDLK